MTLQVTINNGRRREVKYRQTQEVLVDIPERITEHGLSSEITQSLGGSSDTSEGSKNSGSFEDYRSSGVPISSEPTLRLSRDKTSTTTEVVDVLSGDNLSVGSDEMGTPVVDDHMMEVEVVVSGDNKDTNLGGEEVVVKKKRVEFSQAFSAAYDVLEKKVWDFLAGNISPSEVASIFNCVVSKIQAFSVASSSFYITT
ncbi:hypothetical protein Tco_0950372 [Tanacetum coccineum]